MALYAYSQFNAMYYVGICGTFGAVVKLAPQRLQDRILMSILCVN